MLEKIKEGYVFFVRYDENSLVATMTLKDNDIYKDVDRLEDSELNFLNDFDNVKELLNEEIGLSIVYDSDEDKYISSIKNKAIIGEYNDKVVWNDKVSSIGIDIISSLNSLDSKLLKERERSIL